MGTQEEPASHDGGRRRRGRIPEPTRRKAMHNDAPRRESRLPLTQFHLLAASVAHEIRNSLAGVKSTVEVLETDYAEQTEKRQVLKEVLRSLHGVNNMVADLLEYTKPLTANKKAVRLLESLEAVVATLQVDTRLQCIKIIKEYRCNPELQADPNLLERLFLNLILNAVQAMKFSGQLRIRVAKRSKDVSISFIDKGCGMERGVQERLFGPFFSTKACGTGLGLFLCKKYVDAHDGRIEVKTEAGQGSTFTVLLPSRSTRRMGQDI